MEFDQYHARFGGVKQEQDDPCLKYKVSQMENQLLQLFEKFEIVSDFLKVKFGAEFSGAFDDGDNSFSQKNFNHSRSVKELYHADNVNLRRTSVTDNEIPIELVEDYEDEDELDEDEDQFVICTDDMDQIEGDPDPTGDDESTNTTDPLAAEEISVYSGHDHDKARREREKESGWCSQQLPHQSSSGKRKQELHPRNSELQFETHLNSGIGVRKSASREQSNNQFRQPSSKNTLKVHRIESLNLDFEYEFGVGSNPFICLWDKCKRGFATLGQLRNHHITKHTEGKYKCDWPNCDKSFTSSPGLLFHKRAHLGDKPYQCDWPGCGKAFVRSSDRNTHRRIHNGDRRYKCQFCEASFIQKGALEGHVNTHTGKKPYSCEGCGQAFGSASIFWTHKKRCSFRIRLGLD